MAAIQKVVPHTEKPFRTALKSKAHILKARHFAGKARHIFLTGSAAASALGTARARSMGETAAAAEVFEPAMPRLRDFFRTFAPCAY